jgi:hypothetical protein
MPDQMRYEQQPGPPYPARFDVPRPPIAEGWPAPPGGWPDTQWITTLPISGDPDAGASTKADQPLAATPPPSDAGTAPQPPAEGGGGPQPSLGAGPPPGHWPHYAPPAASGRPKHLALILSIIAGVVMVGVIGVATTATIFATRSYRAAQIRPAVGMDTPVRDGEFQFTVDGMRCGVHEIGTPDDYASPTGQFCVVTMSIMNVGKNPAVFADGIQKAYGAGGVSFISDSEAGLYANPDPNVFLNDINPGNKVQVLIVYDIPPAGHIVKLEVHENPSTKGAIIKTS